VLIRAESSRRFSVEKRHFEHMPRVDRPPSALYFATSSSLPATQGQRSKGVSSLMGASKAALRLRSQAATGEEWLKSVNQSSSPTGTRVVVI